MEFDFYRNFLVLAESNTMSAAARKLNIVQTALSSQITKLEDYYGVKLVKRQKGSKHIELTAAGIEFVAKVRKLCQSEDELALAMEKYDGNVFGTIRFGVSPMRSHYFIERYLMPFTKLHPRITFMFEEMLTVDQVDKIRAGSIDFAFSNAAIKIYPEFGTINFEREKLFAVYREDLTVPCDDKEYIEIKDLAGLPLCSYSTQFSLLRRFYEKQGIRLQTHFMTNTLHTTLTVVKNSNNIGVIAATPHETLAEGLAKKPIKDSQLEFNKIFYWNKDRTMGLAAETFLAYFREEAKKDGAEV